VQVAEIPTQETDFFGLGLWSRSRSDSDSGSLQKWLESLDNNAHIWPELSFILHT